MASSLPGPAPAPVIGNRGSYRGERIHFCSDSASSLVP